MAENAGRAGLLGTEAASNVSTNVHNKVRIERQLTAVTALETALLHQPTSVQ
jgi:hypothetical protein